MMVTKREAGKDTEGGKKRDVIKVRGEWGNDDEEGGERNGC